VFKEYSSFTGSKFIGLALIGIVALKLVLRNYPPSLFRTRLWMPMLLLLGFYVLSAYNSLYLDLASTPIRQLITAIIIFTVTLVMGNEIDLNQIVTAIVLSVVLSSLFSMLQSFGEPADRVTGLLADPNSFALLLCAAFPLALLRVKNEKKVFFKYFWLAVVLTVIISVMKTYSRSGLVVLGFIGGIITIYYRDDIRTIHPRYFGLVLAAILFSVSAAVIFIPDEYVERVKSLTALKGGVTNFEDRSLGRRASYFYVGMAVVKSHPILGNGPGSFPYNFAKSEYASALAYSSDEIGGDLYRRAHNTYLEILAEIGILGLLVFLFMISVVYRNFKKAGLNYRGKNDIKNADLVMHLWCSFIAISAFLLFISDTKNKYFWILMAISQIVLNRSVKQNDVSIDNAKGD